MTNPKTLTISGYQILNQIYESSNSLVYRGIREKGSQPVIIKVLKQNYPSPQELTRYKQEYEITRNLNLPGVIKAWELQPYQRTNGTINNFPLGSNDHSDRFQIPQKLYGREKEVAQLLEGFERVAFPLAPLGKEDLSKARSELMLVAGYSGIGKSALVAEVYKPITKKRGYFIEGKFDQFQRNIPYSAIVSAFKALMQQLFTESKAQLQQWREKLLEALGSNGQVVIDVIPEVELIIGKQPPVTELGATESQNRFNLVLQNFIRAFCSVEHPLVIFLDDLQWTDGATLKLLELIITDQQSQYLFVIGAYRDNEVSSSHPLMMVLDESKKQGATVNQITLAPLQSEDINQLVADTVHSDLETAKPLTELVQRKTNGNPFFVNQFLKTLYSEDLISFSLTKSCQWQWNLAQIEAQNITDNVVELIIDKVKKLPEATQQVLRLAACVGADFDLKTLAIILQKSTPSIFQDLLEALLSDLIRPISDLDEQLLIQKYQFEHDRVQQAAYGAALDYLSKGLRLLTADSWQQKYDLTLTLYSQATEAAYLSGDFEQMEQLAEIVLNN
ncbi:MAG: AAA family ATPase, partial [Spirulinaceae cyanobacterium]